MLRQDQKMQVREMRNITSDILKGSCTPFVFSFRTYNKLFELTTSSDKNKKYNNIRIKSFEFLKPFRFLTKPFIIHHSKVYSYFSDVSNKFVGPLTVRDIKI